MRARLHPRARGYGTGGHECAPSMPMAAPANPSPAGLIEPTERGLDGIRAGAVREAEEETGIRLTPDALTPLGAPSFLCPGVIAEQLHYFAVALPSATLGTPEGDGSPVEERAALAFVPFADALEMTRDVKTELGVRRLMALVGGTL